MLIKDEADNLLLKVLWIREVSYTSFMVTTAF